MLSTIECGPRQGLTHKASADGRPVHPGEQQHHRVKGVLRRCDSRRLCQRDKGKSDPRLLKHVACLGLETTITHPCCYPYTANAYNFACPGAPT